MYLWVIRVTLSFTKSPNLVLVVVKNVDDNHIIIFILESLRKRKSKCHFQLVFYVTDRKLLYKDKQELINLANSMVLYRGNIHILVCKGSFFISLGHD